MGLTRKLALAGFTAFVSVSLPIIAAKRAEAGAASQPILNTAGQFTGGTAFLACEKNPTGSPGRTLITYQLNAALTTPFVSVGPLFFQFPKPGLFGRFQDPYTYKLNSAQFNFRQTLKQTFTIGTTIYNSVELRGTAQGISPARPTAGGINYRIGDAVGTGRESDRLSVQCD